MPSLAGLRRLRFGWPGGLGWRVRRVAGWAAADFGAGVLQLVARVRLLRHIPRLCLIPAERMLIAWRGQGLFDHDFYLAQNADVADAGHEPFAHYLRHGWREGRAPNARFDDGHYRAAAGLSRHVPISPLAHFLAFGRRIGLCPVPGVDLEALGTDGDPLSVARIDPYRHLLSADRAPGPERPDLDAALLRLDAMRAPSGAPEVAVVVPVYAGRAETLNTLCHVLGARCRTRYRLVVINDASPEPALVLDLRHLAQRGLIELIENPVNRGFVASVNAGTARHPQLDAIWLNADTEVYDGWIDRLRAAAYSRAEVATVTPLTNNGTICSYPRFDADNPGRLEVDFAELDRLAARFNRRAYVPAPTGVGFAMYVRRDALSAIGPLDEAAFGRGYGEENDFCQRAIAAGRVNLIAADTFVRHFGATSFQGSKADRVEAAMRVLDRRYPGYRRDVRAFIAADPLREHRRALDLARLARLSTDRNVLIVSHCRGGGTEQHVQEAAARLEAKGASVFRLTEGDKPGHVSLGHASAAAAPSLQGLAVDGDWLWRAIEILRIGQVQVHHLIGMGDTAPDLLARRLARAGLPYSFVVHDYFSVCPRINMVDLSGRYCGEPGRAACQTCIELRGSPAGRVSIRDWRAGYARLLRNATEVVVPDADVGQRLARHFPGLEALCVRPHEDAAVPRAWPSGPRAPGPLRIAVIGAIGPIKGFDTVLGLARFLRRRPRQGEISLIGYSRDDAALRGQGVAVSGPYLNAHVDQELERADPDLIWIPSLWPETYCYTLSIALRSGRPVAAFDLGAQASRLRDVDRGHLIPLGLADQPAALWAALTRAAARAPSPDLSLAS